MILFLNASQVATCAGPPRARKGGEMSDAVIHKGWAIGVDGEHIAAVGPQDELRRQFPDAREIDCAGTVITPGLVDSHTHAVFGRARYEEQELRGAVASYMEIARRGGGIHASVADFTTRTEDHLF